MYEFRYFFDPCEQGFKTSLIINLYCKICPINQTLVSSGKKFRELYFIKDGAVGLYTETSSSSINSKTQAPFLVLPRHSIFGDYQIMHDLKSTIEFRCFFPNQL